MNHNQKYHYEYFAYTDNLCWGRLLLGKSQSMSGARTNAESANRGAWKIERRRVYDSENV